jgi:hypothetical protein
MTKYKSNLEYDVFYWDGSNIEVFKKWLDYLKSVENSNIARTYIYDNCYSEPERYEVTMPCHVCYSDDCLLELEKEKIIMFIQKKNLKKKQKG